MAFSEGGVSERALRSLIEFGVPPPLPDEGRARAFLSLGLRLGVAGGEGVVADLSARIALPGELFSPSLAGRFFPAGNFLGEGGGERFRPAAFMMCVFEGTGRRVLRECGWREFCWVSHAGILLLGLGLSFAQRREQVWSCEVDIHLY